MGLFSSRELETAVGVDQLRLLRGSSWTNKLDDEATSWISVASFLWKSLFWKLSFSVGDVAMPGLAPVGSGVCEKLQRMVQKALPPIKASCAFFINKPSDD